MKYSPKELIAFPHNADLDHLGAVRCLLLKFPQAKILHPVKFKQNAWECGRRLEWFKTLKFNEIDFSAVKKVHLVGITQPRQNPELIEEIARHAPAAIVYSEHSALLPFPFDTIICQSLSLSSSLMNKLRSDNYKFAIDDIQLLTLSVTEKTWAGLSPKIRNEDMQALSFLRRYNISPGKIANMVVLGLREGQTGLYHHMLKNIEDIQPGFWPISLIAVKTTGQVQDVEPVVDAVWSDIGQPILLVLLTSGSFTRVWGRSNISQVDFFEVFNDFRPTRSRNWVYFHFAGSTAEQNKVNILTHLRQNLKPDLAAGDIMSASPQCIEWNSTIRKALDMMLKFNIMSLIVLKNNEFAGIVTRRDLDRALQMNLLDAEIGPYVPTNVPTVSPATPVRVLKNLMVRFNLTRLPVLRDSEVIGIITTHELLRALPDYLPLPPDFLPLAEQTNMPSSTQIEEIVKRVFSLRIFHLLSKIGRFAAQKGVAVFAIGGFVRDLLLERPNFDIDIVVIGDAMPFAAELAKEFNCDHKIFDRFHTARIYLEDLKVDFSSARIEHYSDPGALPQIEFSGLSNDLYRRDFTINALALSLNPEHFMELKDFFGGYNDLLHKHIRILHSFSFLEDPTRLFRALRFSGRFNFSLEQDTRRAFELAISREAASRLSLKRIGAEVSKCFNEERPQQVVAELFSAGLMTYLSPELSDSSILPGRFKLIKGLVKRFSVLPDEIDSEAIYWSGLLSLLPPEIAVSVLDSIGTPHNRRQKIIETLSSMTSLPSQLTRIDEHDNHELFKMFNELSIETLIALMAFSLDKRNARKILHFISNLRNIRCVISGKDLIEMGIKPGPHMRYIFNHIIELKLGGAQISKEEEIKIAQQLYKNI
ncbi:MAG: CBS domain-containing protein [Erysipelotrichia bacterium]|nr:CBS domain-containing protein [Erysipelotrichia bacterium]